MSVFFITRQRC